MQIHRPRPQEEEDPLPPAERAGLPPREAPVEEAELVLNDEARRVESDPPQVLDLEELALNDEAARVESDPPQVLDLKELVLNDEARRVESDPPQVLDLEELALNDEAARVESDPPQVLDLKELVLNDVAAHAESDTSPIQDGIGPLTDSDFVPVPEPEPERPRITITPSVGSLPDRSLPDRSLPDQSLPDRSLPDQARPRIKLTIKPRAATPSLTSAEPPVEGESASPAPSLAIGSPLTPRKSGPPLAAGLVAARPVPKIDAELVPQEVQEQFVANRQSQDTAVAAHQARGHKEKRRVGVGFGVMFVIGSLMLSALSLGIVGVLALALAAAIGGGTGWHLASKRPNRLGGAVTTWAAALVLTFLQVALAVGVHGSGVVLGLFFPFLIFTTSAALVGVFTCSRLESLEMDQEI